jgi:hypothetical protein
LNRINYSNYSLDDLNEALDSINREAYPENYQKLINEIKLRHKKAPVHPDKLNEVNKKHSNNKEPLNDYWNPKKAKENLKSALQRFFVVKLLIIIGVLCLPAYFNSYLIGENYYEPLQLIAWFISIITFIYSYKKVKVNSKNKDRSNVEKKLIILFVAIILGFTSYFISTKSLPVLAHVYFLDNYKTSKLVTVSNKGFRFRRKHCNGKVYLKEYEYADLAYICGVLSKKTWNSLEVGDRIKIFGTQSNIGFLVKGAKKMR